MRILIVDDLPANRRLLSLIVSGLGYAADEACSGTEAVDLCSRDAYDLVFMDLQMPGMDGFEAARRIRGCSPGPVRIIALSGFAGDEAAAQSAEAGMDSYIAKPYAIDAISAAISAAAADP